MFKTKTRDEWCDLMEGTDVCFAPVLSMTEAAEHPHNKERGTFTELDGVLQPSPAPRFSRTSPAVTHGSRFPGEDTSVVLKEAGYSEADIKTLVDSGAVSQAKG